MVFGWRQGPRQLTIVEVVANSESENILQNSRKHVINHQKPLHQAPESMSRGTRMLPGPRKHVIRHSKNVSPDTQKHVTMHQKGV